MREVLKLFLEKIYEELDVTPVESGFEALEKLKKERFKLIISDYQMPGMNGLELLREIRLSGLSDTPFILYSSNADDKKISDEVLAAGASFVHGKNGSPPLCYFELVGKILDAIHCERKVEDIEHIFTEDMLAEKTEKLLRGYLDSIVKHLGAKGALLIVYTNSREIRLYSSNLLLTEKEDCSATNHSETSSILTDFKVLEIPLTVGETELGLLRTFVIENASRKNLTEISLIGRAILSVILERISRPDE
jgi:CheY-like chemotaxis protein